MKKILLVLIITFITSSYAEPVSLWCTDGNSDQANSANSDAPAKINSSKEKIKKLVELKKKMELSGWWEMAELVEIQLLMYQDIFTGYTNAQTSCVDSDWFSAHEFIFDTDGLKNDSMSAVEYTSVGYCGGLIKDTIEVKLSSSPSVIYFEWMKRYLPDDIRHLRFSVDRKTLTADLDNQISISKFTCTVRDIDKSDNLI
jgi:hypothetical protein